MVYKKYIKRGDKLFGPYYYKSIKKEGKVITQYVKNPNDFPQKKFSIGSKKIYKNFLILPILFLILVAGFFILKPILTGKVILSVDNSYVSGKTLFGELKLNLEPNEFIPADTKVLINNEEFILKNLIQEESKQGEFYVSGTEISGFGEGYGQEDLDVSFVLSILSEKEEKTPEEETETIEAITENIEIPGTQEESTINDQQLNPEEEINIEEIPEISSAESGITGLAIFNFFNNIFLTITGKTSLENVNEISAKVSKNKPFVYVLEQGQTAKIKNSDKKVNLEIINNTATITTDYSGEETEYLINLSELNISVKDKTLKIKLVYNEAEFYSLSKNFNIEGLNKTNQTIQESNLAADESLIQHTAIAGKPVKWTKKIIINDSEMIVKLPKGAENISVYELNNAPISELNNSITGNLVLSYERENVGFFNRLFTFITGKACLLYTSPSPRD